MFVSSDETDGDYNGGGEFTAAGERPAQVSTNQVRAGRSDAPPGHLSSHLYQLTYPRTQVYRPPHISANI